MKYNLRKIRGTLKGNVGEAIYSSMFGNIHTTKNDSANYIKKLPIHLSQKWKEFIAEYWNTFDAFKFITNEKDEVTNIIFYEIKTMNYYRTKGVNYGKKPVLTHYSAKFYELAQNQGFVVKSIWVVFHDKWEFEIIEKPFTLSDYDTWSGNPQYAKH